MSTITSARRCDTENNSNDCLSSTVVSHSPRSRSFIGDQNAQGKKGAGVKVDRDTPMRYLRETKDALDEIIAFKP